MTNEYLKKWKAYICVDPYNSDYKDVDGDTYKYLDLYTHLVLELKAGHLSKEQCAEQDRRNYAEYQQSQKAKERASMVYKTYQLNIGLTNDILVELIKNDYTIQEALQYLCLALCRARDEEVTCKTLLKKYGIDWDESIEETFDAVDEERVEKLREDLRKKDEMLAGPHA